MGAADPDDDGPRVGRGAAPRPTGRDVRPGVLLSADDGVATVVIDRPHVRGALDAATRTALLEVVRQVADDDAVRCVVLTGSGGAFSAGQDLREHAEQLRRDDPALRGVVTEQYAPLALALATMPKPVVASLPGVAAGAGAALAMAADLRLMAASAGVDTAFTRIGLPPDTGASWWLPRLVGAGRARELLLLPRTVPAAECVDIGLATEAVADSDLAARTQEVARRLADGPTAAYAAVRRAMAFSATHDLPDSLAHEAELVEEVGRSAQHRALVEAFVAARAARRG